MHRILIVEDNPIHAKMIKYCLENRGYFARCIERGDYVVSEIDDFLPHIVLMDIEIPGISGVESAITIRNTPQIKNLPIFAVTATHKMQFHHQGYKQYFDEYIEKPIILSELLLKMAKYLNNKV